MKKITQLFIAFAMIVGIGAMALPATPAQAVDVFGQCGANKNSSVCKSTGDDANKMIKIVINLILSVLGIISVIMIILGGIRYTTSGGDSAGIKTARDTIIYAIVGLVIAILAFAIVNFVLDSFI
jgi:type IV secretion system pilin